MSDILKNFFHTWHDFHHVEVRPHFLSEKGRDEMLKAIKDRQEREYANLQHMEDGMMKNE